MNPRKLINFIKSPTGALLCFGLLVAAALLVANRFSDPDKPKEPKSRKSKTQAKATNEAQTVHSFTTGILPFKLPGQKEPKSADSTAPVTKAEHKIEIPPISLYAEATPNQPEPKQLSNVYAPYGRLIPCELVITVDSSSIRTPIVGLVTEDIYHAGKLIIPAGTEVHGKAQVDHVRERIASSGSWTLVWQSGEELTIRGIALDREKDADKSDWGITDGSAGLRGRILKSDDMAEIKLFAASFLSAAASSMTEHEQTVFGTQELPSLQNAPFKGAQGVLAAYARQIYDAIQRDGFYVRVPAGKQFYLYVTQTIDRADAAPGTSLSEESDDALSPAPAKAIRPTASYLAPSGALPETHKTVRSEP